MSKLILNTLPPIEVIKPSISLEVLKSYMKKKGINDIEIIYWNLIVYDILLEAGIPKNHILINNNSLLPFHYMLLEEHDVQEKITDLLITLQSIIPSHKVMRKDYYKLFLKKVSSKIEIVFKNKLKSILTDDVKIFGISAKYDAWISGYFLAKWAKEIKPDIKVVIGGFENIINAKAVFEKFKIYDIAVFGEGEESLYKIYNYFIKKDIDIINIPQIIYKKGNELIVNTNNADNDFNYSFPDNIDFFKQINNRFTEKELLISIETSRGCRWNKCNFCALNWGLSYKEKEEDNIVKEIRYNYEKHGIKSYFFTDNDVVGKRKKRFENLLNKLIKLGEDLNTEFELHADVLHLTFDKILIKKMSLAGFKSVQIGYEGITDEMLKKLNKSTTFADNLLFLKFSNEFDINCSATGLIIGIPEETKNDVLESLENLHFLRFFLNEKEMSKPKFTHRFAELVLFYNTTYWKMLNEKNRRKFNLNPTYNLMPDDMFDEKERYSLFGLTKSPDNINYWEQFMSVSNFYEKNNFRYYLLTNNNKIHYLEYQNDLQIDSVIFDDILYWDTLSFSNDKVISFNKLFELLSEKYIDLTKDKLQNILEELKNKYLLYASNDYKKIVSIINTDNLK